jgi:hypothetical protein
MTRDCLPLTEFGADKKVSNWEVGKANIEEEYTSAENQFFVLHDSKGFETASSDTYDTVKNFIEQRRNKTDLKDRLHAVW